MDRRRFAKRTATLIAAAALPGFAHAQKKSEEERAKSDKPDPNARAEEQKTKAAEEKHEKSPEGRAEEQKTKAEEKGVKSGKAPEEHIVKAKNRLEEKNAKGMAKGPAEEKAKSEEGAAKKKGATLDDRRWEREQEAKRFAALRRVGKLLG